MLIVNFHNVIAGTPDVYDRKAAPRVDLCQFTSALDALSKRFELVSLPELLSRLERRAYDDHVATLTFDDGYSGVLHHAFPILEARGIKASVMVVTQTLGPAPALLHYEEIEMAFRISKASTLELPGRGEQPIQTETERVRCLLALKQELKLQPEPARRRNHDDLLRSLHVTRDQITAESKRFPVFDKLSRDHLRFLASSGWTIGSHTRTHRTLSCLDDDDVMQELAGSRDDIRTLLGVADMPFAYPYGGPQHIGDRAHALAQTCGYSCVLTTTPGRIPRGADRSRLPRAEGESLDEHRLAGLDGSTDGMRRDSP